MKKSFLLLLCLMLVMTLMFVACAENKEDATQTPTEEHEHTYATEWSSDATNHWHAASCAHTNEVADLAAHTDADNDGVCDVCAYVTCEHTFAEAWSSDGANHWHAATCQHVNIKGDVAAHVDEDKDGVCDVCEVSFCDHEWATVWSSDENGHWYAAVCDKCTDAVKDYAAHTGMKDGICDVCNYGDHEHTWGEWKWDNTVTDEKTGNHWQLSSCEGHDPIKSNEGTHADANWDGNCDTCGYAMCTHTYNDHFWATDGENHFHLHTCDCDIPDKDVAACTDADKDGYCDVCEGELHTEHTWENPWYGISYGYNATQHWMLAQCCNATSEPVDHEGMEDGICDTCGYGDHVHTWGEWVYDENGHFHESTCETHSPIRDEQTAGEHIDLDSNIECDICGYNYGHDHTYATEWTSDERGHWYATTCGHETQGSYAKHDTDGVNGECSVCGRLTVAGIIDDASSDENVNKVSGGTGSYTQYGLEHQIEYAFGKNYTYFKDFTDEDHFEYWHHALEGGKVFSLQKRIYQPGTEYETDYGVQKYAEASQTDMYGPKISLSFIDYSFDTPAYGVEDLVYQVYNYAITSEAVFGNVDVVVDGNKYTLTFNYLNNGSYRVINVEFVVTDGVITSVDMTYTAYWDQAEDAEHTAGMDFVVIGNKVVLLESAEADQTFTLSFTQTVGERNAVSPYNVDEILVQDFTVSGPDGAITEETEFVVGESYTWTMTGITPDTVDLTIDKPTFTAKVNGSELWWWDFSMSVDPETKQMTFNPKKPGNWEIVISTATMDKVLNFTVAKQPTTELKPTVNGSQVTTTNAFTGIEFNFSANAQNTNADNAFTASCDSDKVTLTKSETTAATYSFVASEKGTYTVTLTSVSNPEVTATLTVVVSDPLNVTEYIFDGTYTCDLDWGGYVKVTFDTATQSGSVAAESWGIPYEDTFEYTVDGGVFRATFTDGSNFMNFNFNNSKAKFEIVFAQNGPTPCELTPPAGPNPPAPGEDADYILDGEYTAVVDAENGETITVTFDTVNKTGTAEYINSAAISFNRIFTYTVEDGVFKATFEELSTVFSDLVYNSETGKFSVYLAQTETTYELTAPEVQGSEVVILDGTYTCNLEDGNYINVTFHKNEQNGSVIGSWGELSYEDTFTYTVSGGKFTAEFAGGEEGSFKNLIYNSETGTFSIICSYIGNMPYQLTAPAI